MSAPLAFVRALAIALAVALAVAPELVRALASAVASFARARRRRLDVASARPPMNPPLTSIPASPRNVADADTRSQRGYGSAVTWWSAGQLALLVLVLVLALASPAHARRLPGPGGKVTVALPRKSS